MNIEMKKHTLNSMEKIWTLVGGMLKGGFWLRVFGPLMREAFLVNWVSVSDVWLSEYVAAGKGFGVWRRRVFEGESVWVWEWVIWVGFSVWRRRVFEGENVSVWEWGCLSEFVFESLILIDQKMSFCNLSL